MKKVWRYHITLPAEAKVPRAHSRSESVGGSLVEMYGNCRVWEGKQFKCEKGGVSESAILTFEVVCEKRMKSVQVMGEAFKGTFKVDRVEVVEERVNVAQF